MMPGRNMTGAAHCGAWPKLLGRTQSFRASDAAFQADAANLSQLCPNSVPTIGSHRVPSRPA